MTEQQKQPTTATSQAQQHKAKEPKRKYRILVAGDSIERCSYILPNKLQCWKAGEEEVLETDADGKEVHYQYCERHARIRRAIEAGTMQAEDVATQMQAITVEPPVSAPEKEVVSPPQGEHKNAQEELKKQQETAQQQAAHYGASTGQEKAAGTAEEGNRPFFKKESEVQKEEHKPQDKK